jgi:uncharacterized protein YdhG (YjbR/CyaY superfamily)
MAATAKKATKTTGRKTNEAGWTDEEKAAMKEHAAELKRARTRKGKAADGLADLRAKIDEMPPSDRTMAERIHEIVSDVAPDLVPRTWYGMPAWANGDGKVVCFFTPASKFKERYASFGFNAEANLDDGAMWPTAFALTKLTKADEKRIAELVKKAVS